MLVASILKTKGREVETARPDTPLLEIARTLARKKILGAIVLTQGGAVVGIVSERDIVRCIGTEGLGVMDRTVADVMTRDVVTCREQDTVDRLMALMTVRRFRHLPVLEGGQLVGIISMATW